MCGFGGGYRLSEGEISSTFRMDNEDGSSILLQNYHAVSQLAGTKPVHNLVPIIILFTKHDGRHESQDKVGEAKHVDPHKFGPKE